ncbi:MAG: hypothetical protein ACPL7C_11165, partial [Anaerolineae bacterium]
ALLEGAKTHKSAVDKPVVRFGGSDRIAKNAKDAKIAKKRGIQNLYYIAPIENLPSILREGILGLSTCHRRKRCLPSF